MGGLGLALLLLVTLLAEVSPRLGLQTGAVEVSGVSCDPGTSEPAEHSLSSEYFLDRRDPSSPLLSPSRVPCSVLMLLLVSSGFFLVDRSRTVSPPPLPDGPGW